MFTGIIEATGSIKQVLKKQNSTRFVVTVQKLISDAKVGDSISVNGACLTLTHKSLREFSFDVLEETLRLTNLRTLRPGSLVNLERALSVGTRLGGHFVSGHVDGTGKILSLQRQGKDTMLRIATPPDLMRHVVYKGSIAVDGISLTVAGVDGDSFSVFLIPHTLKATNLQNRHEGDLVNLEVDIIGKYVEKLLEGHIAALRPPKGKRIRSNSELKK